MNVKTKQFAQKKSMKINALKTNKMWSEQENIGRTARNDTFVNERKTVKFLISKNRILHILIKQIWNFCWWHAVDNFGKSHSRGLEVSRRIRCPFKHILATFVKHPHIVSGWKNQYPIWPPTMRTPNQSIWMAQEDTSSSHDFLDAFSIERTCQKQSPFKKLPTELARGSHQHKDKNQLLPKWAFGEFERQYGLAKIIKDFSLLTYLRHKNSNH